MSLPMSLSTAAVPAPAAPSTMPAGLLRASGILWFTVAATGQLAFIGFIVLYYYRRTFSGNLAAWNEKPLIQGYTPGDTAGNAMFAVHVLCAALITLSGLLQLIPGLRKSAPALHRWSGRVFMALAVLMATGGLWLVIVRGTWLSVISAIPTSINGVLILITAALALYFAVTRRIDRHRRWAMRLWLLVNGVWFLRVLLMAYVMATGGAGMNRTMSGPADLALGFGSYLAPLAVLQLYLMAQDARSAAPKLAMSAFMVVCTAVTALGTVGAVMFMWWPYI